jgi:Mg-chelatase subunit ChlD
MSSADSIMKALEEERKKAYKHSILAAIAEDEVLHMEFASNVDGKKFEDIDLTSEMARKVARKINSGIDSAIRMIIKAQRVSICFVLDTTGSMERHILGVKNKIATIVESIQRSHAEICGISFIGYKDWCDGDEHFEVLNFTCNVSLFKSFVSAIVATGGGDIPEDVLGGLKKAAIALNWPSNSGTRIVFHIADAPPHGNPFYHSYSDEFPSGHQKDISLTNLFRAIYPLLFRQD